MINAKATATGTFANPHVREQRFHSPRQCRSRNGRSYGLIAESDYTNNSDSDTVDVKPGVAIAISHLTDANESQGVRIGHGRYRR